MYFRAPWEGFFGVGAGTLTVRQNVDTIASAASKILMAEGKYVCRARMAL
jgi:hypothetical protein